MTRWTNGHWKSTLHRVTNPVPAKASSSRRLSVAFFHKPNYDALIEVLPTCCLEGLGGFFESNNSISRLGSTQQDDAGNSGIGSSSNGTGMSGCTSISSRESGRMKKGVAVTRGDEAVWLGSSAGPAKYPPVLAAELARAGILHKYRHLPAEEASKRYHEELAATRLAACRT